MDWLQFFSAVIESVAWPLAAIACAITFRKPLVDLLKALTSIDWKGVKAEFRRDVERLTEEVNELPPAEVPNSSPVQDTVHRLALMLTAGNPQQAVAMAWGQVDRELRETCHRIGLAPPTDGLVPPQLLIGLLYSEGYIDISQKRVFDILIDLRNKASLIVDAGNMQNVITSTEYVNAAWRMVQLLRGLMPKNASSQPTS